MQLAGIRHTPLVDRCLQYARAGMATYGGVMHGPESRSPRQLLVIAAGLALGSGLLAFVLSGCEGPSGAAAASTVIRTSVEPAGSNCAAGGTKVESGVDANGNGALDEAELNSALTYYVCNGSAGSGSKGALIKTTPEAAGSNCPNGGSKVEVGVDANGNGVLDPSEVNASQTTFICNGATGANGGTLSTGLTVTVKSVSTSATAPITVRFLLKDDRGLPVDLAGIYSTNTAIQPRFSLSYFTKDAKGIVSPLTVYTKAASSSNPTAMPTAYNPLGTAAGHGTLVENGSGGGDYTYTFPTAATTNGPIAVVYDATKLGETHVLWIQASRQIDLVYPSNGMTYYTANQDYYFIPSGTGTPAKREIVVTDNCSKCHDKFKPESDTANAFHSGGRIDAKYCNVCHNPGRTSNPAADSKVFVHRIHFGEELQEGNQFHGIAATYPQDIRRCDTCHKGAAQGDQSRTAPSRAACGSCHDAVDFTGTATGSAGPLPNCTNPVTLDADGKPVPCKHVGGIQNDDSLCSSCHTPAKIDEEHQTIVPPDPNNGWAGGTNNNTNASYLAASGYVPKGAAVITYDLKSVDAVDDAAIAPNKRPQITFKLKKDGTDVVFQTYAAGTTTELMAGFVGSPSVYFAFAVPQDGNKTPADFNASASGYIKNIWSGTATGTGAGTLTGPDASGYYTIKLTGVQVPASATLLTGGVGYSYSLSSTPPLTQIDLPAFPYNTDGKKQGGLSVPAPNVWKVATKFTGRRPIVDNKKCESCHVRLGVAPTFHAGQRNDGPTCSFCHTPNRTSSGWSAGSRYFIHGIHSGRMRTQPYTWHATEPGLGYGDVEFPSPLGECKACHASNTHDFTATASLAAVPNLMLQTVATGKYDKSELSNPASYYTISPYVVADNVKDYGSGFSFAGATGAATEAVGTTLVITPVTAVCSACHDAQPQLDHMKANGGRFYAPRSEVLAPGAAQEQCLQCHGPGTVAAIGRVHY
jgi:OmcA/MtrC family decaheme c-type cytochrome